MTKGLAQRPDNELFFREWLRTQRMRRGFSVEQLARALDSSSSLYDDYERGEAQIPPPLFGRIANLLGAAVPFLSNEGFHELQDTDELASSGDPSVFRIATTEERAQRSRRTGFGCSTLKVSNIFLAMAAALLPTAKHRLYSRTLGTSAHIEDRKYSTSQIEIGRHGLRSAARLCRIQAVRMPAPYFSPGSERAAAAAGRRLHHLHLAFGARY